MAVALRRDLVRCEGRSSGADAGVLGGVGLAIMGSGEVAVG